MHENSEDSSLSINATLSARLAGFSNRYKSVHPPLVISICIFGVLCNLANVIVLTKPKMRTSPTNVILTGLSVSQICLLINFLCYTIYVTVDDDCDPSTRTYYWLVYLLLNVNMNVLFHTIGLVHTCLIAVFRYIAVGFAGTRSHWVTVARAKRCIFITYALVPLACSTFYFNSEIVNSVISPNCTTFTTVSRRVHDNVTALIPPRDSRTLKPQHFRDVTTLSRRVHDNSTTVIRPYGGRTLEPQHFLDVTTLPRGFHDGLASAPTPTVIYNLSFTSNELLLAYNFWVLATFCKLMPCVCLVVLSALLLYELHKVRQRRKRLRRQSRLSSHLTVNNSTIVSAGLLSDNHQSQQHHKITIMLLMVVLLFVTVELPQGVLNLMAAVKGFEKIRYIHGELADFFDMLTVFYSSVNFILYCAMSSQFRQCFRESFLYLCDNKFHDGTPVKVGTKHLCTRQSNGGDYINVNPVALKATNV